MEATDMRTNKNLDDLKNLGVDTQRFDINSRIDMIIHDINEQLKKWGDEAAMAFGLSEEARKNIKLGGIGK